MKTRKQTIKEYKNLFTNEPSKFDIWWYQHEVYKFAWGFGFGVIIGGLLL